MLSDRVTFLVGGSAMAQILFDFVQTLVGLTECGDNEIEFHMHVSQPGFRCA